MQNSGQAEASGAAVVAQQVIIDALAAAFGDVLPGEPGALDPRLLYEVVLDAIKIHDEAQEQTSMIHDEAQEQSVMHTKKLDDLRAEGDGGLA